jgi:uroporphyrinogen-III synthase
VTSEASPGKKHGSGYLPLEGRTILVTRARQQAGRLTSELQTLGAQVVEIPTIEISPPASYDPLDRALRDLHAFDWIIVTSSNTVNVLRERMIALRLPPSIFSHLEIAAIGSATAEAVRDLGLKVAFMPPEYVAESLIAALGDQIRGQNVLLVRAAIARDVIPEALRQKHALLTVVDAYSTVIPPESIGKIRTTFGEGARMPDAATFTSSSTVANFFALLREAGIHDRPRNMPAISIGPITSQTLRGFGWQPSTEADPHTVPGLVAATVRALNPES